MFKTTLATFAPAGTTLAGQPAAAQITLKSWQTTANSTRGNRLEHAPDDVFGSRPRLPEAPGRVFSRRAGLGALLGLIATRAQAQDHGPIRAEAGWSRAAGAGRVGVGYLTLRNAGPADRLIAARAEIARTVELHAHIRDGDVMRMRPLEAVDLPAGGAVTLQPGGLHLMLIELRQPLQQGETVPVTLVFEKAGEVQVQLAVQSAGARGPHAAMPHAAMPDAAMPHAVMPDAAMPGGAHRH